MTLVSIKTTRRAEEERKFLHNGLKPFFLFGAMQAVVSMTHWIAMYTFHVFPSDMVVSPSHLHAHEMLYGFTFAIIAGFLLAALPAWTSVSTISGRILGALVAIWAVPRILLLAGTSFLGVAAAFDLLFSLSLLVAVAHPIWASRSWRQLGILTKVALLGIGNLCFYLGAYQVLPNGVYLSVYGGLYLIVSLILTVGGRVFPGFLQNALERDVPLVTPRWMTGGTMVFFVAFFVAELFNPSAAVGEYFAISLAAVTLLRLYRWYDREIWSRPLLWGLYLAFVNITFGFALIGSSSYTGISRTLSLHAFTVGSIGLATVAMMVRAALGHYGGDVRNPPRRTSLALLTLVIAEVFRVVMPLLFPGHYGALMMVSQVAWIAAYLIVIRILVTIFFPQRSLREVK